MKSTLILASLLAAIASAGHAAGPPIAVSPGSAVRVEEAGSRCPTFSWGSVEGARGYELAVLAITDEGAVAPEPVLVERIDGGALSWTPPLARCLAAGGTYAWTVRATGTAHDWSQVRMFRAPEGPSLDELIDSLAAFEGEVEVAVGPAGGGRAGPARGAAVAPSAERATSEAGAVEPILILPLDPALLLEGSLILEGGVYFKTPRTRKVRIPASAFVFDGDDFYLIRDGAQLWVSPSTTANRARAPVHTVPDGAEITGFECRVKDQSSSYSVDCDLHLSTSDLSSGVLPASTLGLPVSSEIQTIAASNGMPVEVVGNERIWVEYVVSDALCGMDCIFHSATITYILNEAD